MSAAPRVTVGIRAPYELLDGDRPALPQFIDKAERAHIDRLCVGDHVTFKGGQGYDGLIHATAIAALSRTISVQTAVYLLPLRHPVPVARQVCSLAGLAPGRLFFGVGVGGEDRGEVRACGVDPATRGRRMDESLAVMRRLLAGDNVRQDGEFYQLDDVRILPPPSPPVPIMIGGRSTAALHRVAVHGDGWLGLWVTPSRYADACDEIAQRAAAAGREVARWQHGMHVWCGFGHSASRSRDGLAATMESFYRVPFEKFERYCPSGTPADIAAALRPYVEAGCRSFNLIAGFGDQDEIIDGASEVRALLSEEIE